MIHKLADVETQKIGENTKIWQFTIILNGAKIGDNCNVNCHCFIENSVVIGNNVTIKSGVYLWDGITIEDDVFVGPNVSFTNDMYPRSKNHNKEFLKTLVRKGSSIGAGSIITPGLVIGRYALIGAGSVITKNVGDYELWYGNPAKMKGYVCSCSEKLDKKYICKKCNIKYSKNNNGDMEFCKNDNE